MRFQRIALFFRQTTNIFQSELKRILSDGGVMLLFFGATIIYPLIYSVSYYPEIYREIPVGVIDFDETDASRKMTQMFNATPEVEVIGKFTSLAEAEEAFYRGDIHGVVIIPADFSKDLIRKCQTSVVLYSDASYLLVHKQSYTAIINTVQQFNGQIKQQYFPGNGKPSISYLSEPLYNPTSGYGAYAIPPILILVLQQSMLIGIGMLAGSEKERGIKSFIPIMKSVNGQVSKIIFGKTLAYLTIYIPVSIVMLAIIPRWFNFPHGASIQQLFWLIIPLLLAVAMFGLFLSTLFKSREQSIITLVFTSVPIIFLSGFSWPKESFPPFFEQIALLLPSTHAINAYLQVNVMDVSLEFIIPKIIWLLGLALLFGILTYLNLHRFALKVINEKHRF